MKRVLLLSVMVMSSLEVFAKELLTRDFDTVTLVVAAATNKVESSFGHAMLRFSKNKKHSIMDDVAVEFAADIGSGKLNYLKGIGIGSSYPFAISPQRFQDIYISNVQTQERDLHHYVLDIDPENVHRIIDEINAYAENPSKRYNFLFNNCASVVADVISVALDDEMKGPQEKYP